MKRGLLRTGISALLVVLILGCGGGGGSGAVSSPTPVTPAQPDTAGKVVDGYVMGATVILDVNDDRIFSGSEPRVVVGADGAYSFPGLGLHMVRATGGIDTSTNTPFLGELRAAPGGTVLSPLTTLVVADVESRLSPPASGTASALASSSVSAAETAVKSNLGISSGLALATTDPVAAFKASTSDAELEKLMQRNAAVQVLLQQTTRALTAASGVATPSDALLAAVYKQATRSFAALAAASPSSTTAIDLAATSSTLANTLVANTVTGAKANAEVVAALPASAAAALQALRPASAAAAAAPTITSQVRAVAVTSAATLVASASGNPSVASGNPALDAYVNPSLQVVLLGMAPLLAEAVKSVNTPEVLQALAGTVVAALNAGGTSSAAAAAAAAAINGQITQTLALIPTSAVTNVSPAAVHDAQAAVSSAAAQAIAQAQQLILTGSTTTTTTTSTAATTTTTSTTTSTTLGAVTVSLDALNGSFASPASYDAASAGGRFRFTDDVATASFTNITNFGANDSIAITGVGTNHLIVANDGADVVFTVNANGVVSQITLVGVTSASAIIGSLSDFNALGLGTVSYQ